MSTAKFDKLILTGLTEETTDKPILVWNQSTRKVYWQTSPNARIAALEAKFDVDNNFKFIPDPSYSYNTGTRVLTMSAGWEATINQLNYTNENAVVLPAIPLTTSGYTRIDLIAFTTDNTFIRVPGTQRTFNAIAPQLPPNTLQATFLTVTNADVTIKRPPVPYFGYKASQTISGTVKTDVTVADPVVYVKETVDNLFQKKLIAGPNITINNDDPLNPTISASAGSTLDIKTIDGIPINGIGNLYSKNGIVNESLGIIYSKNNWTDTTDFTISGDATISAVAGKIILGTSVPATFLSVAKINNKISLLEKWRIKATIKVLSNTVSSYGIGFGIDSINPYGGAGLIGRFSTFPTTNVLIINNSTSTTNEVSNVATFPIALNDILLFEINYVGAGVVKVSLTNGNTTVTSYYNYTTSAPFMPNTGQFCIKTFGGDYELQSLLIDSLESKYANVMVIGDSKTQAYNTTSFPSRFCDILRDTYPTVVNSGGGWDRTIEAIARINELKSLLPRIVILNIGSNDKRSGETLANWSSRFLTLKSEMESVGAIVYAMKMFNENVLSFTDYNSFIDANFDIDRIIDAGTLALDSDGVHPANAGNIQIANAIKSKIPTVETTPIINVSKNAKVPNTYFFNSITGNNSTGVFEDSSKPYLTLDYVMGLPTYVGGEDLILQNNGTFVINGLIPANKPLNIKSSVAATLSFSANTNTDLFIGTSIGDLSIDMPKGTVSNDRAGGTGCYFASSAGASDIKIIANTIIWNTSNIGFFPRNLDFQAKYVSSKVSLINVTGVVTDTFVRTNNIYIQEYNCLANNACLFTGFLYGYAEYTLEIGLIKGVGSYQFLSGNNIINNVKCANPCSCGNSLYTINLHFKNSTITTVNGFDLNAGGIVSGIIDSATKLYRSAGYQKGKFINFTANLGLGVINTLRESLFFENCSITSTNSPLNIDSDNNTPRIITIKNCSFEVVNAVPLCTGGASPRIATIKIAGLSTNATLISDQIGTGVTVTQMTNY